MEDEKKEMKKMRWRENKKIKEGLRKDQKGGIERKQWKRRI